MVCVIESSNNSFDIYTIIIVLFCFVLTDVDIGEIKLENLRSKIAIIPQEPTLFQGTVRYNLDPLEQCSDEEIWQCLELANLRPVIEAMDNGLESNIAERLLHKLGISPPFFFFNHSYIFIF